MQLNDAQKLFSETHEGPILVSARAGSGKTTAIISNVQNKYANNIDPQNVCLTTFNREAAQTIVDRLRAIYGGFLDRAPIGTTHSICYRMLHNYNLLPIETNQPKPISKWLTRKSIRDLLNQKMIEAGFDSEILTAISWFKNNMAYIEDKGHGERRRYEKMLGDLATEVEYDVEIIDRAFNNYETVKKDKRCFDYDDLLLWAWQMFQDHQEAKEHYQEQYKYLIVDEFQDTNLIQYELFKMMAGKYNNFAAVGDECQTIYEFRGSDISIIRSRFTKDYPSATRIEFKKSYRSNDQIIQTANNLISNLYSDVLTEGVRGDGPAPKVILTNDEEDQKLGIINQINRSPNHYSDVAVLCRTNLQLTYIEDAFVSNGIPYRLVGNEYFFNRKEISALITYLRLIYEDPQSIELYREIAFKPLQTSRAELNQWHTYYHMIETRTGLRLKNKIDEMIDLKERGFSLYQMIEAIIRPPIGLKYYALDLFEGNSNPNLEGFEFVKDMARDKTFEDFYAYVKKCRSSYGSPESVNGVTLSTIHRAKGLEWAEVYIPFVNMGVFPSYNTTDYSEPRRIMYVGITRAKDNLFLLANAKQPVSPFVIEMDGAGDLNVECHTDINQVNGITREFLRL